MRQRPLLPLALLLAVLWLASMSLSTPRRALAAPAGGAEFEGSGQDGTRVSIAVTASATTATVILAFTNVTPGCPFEARFTDVALARSGTEFRAESVTVLNAVNATLGVQSVVGLFETLRYASANGAYEFVPTAGISCPPRRIAWRAGSTTAAATASKLGPGYSSAAGSAFLLTGGPAVGVVSLRAQEAGLGLASFAVTYRQGACEFTGELPATRLYDAGPSLEYKDGRWAFTVGAHPSSWSGGIAIAADGACPAVALTYVATAGANVPALPTPPAGSGGSGSGTISGTIPRSGGFGLVVFGGGTIEQLVAATGCPAASMAMWATVNGAFVGYIPGTAIAAPNAAFVAAFPGRAIPAGTAFVGKCA